MSRNCSRHSVVAVILPLALLLAGGCATPGGKSAAPVTVSNPYADVDWATWGQYKANLHTHTTQSDGKLKPADVIRLYQSKGYKILALTDHETVTWPWTKFGVDPQEVGMVTVQGAELYTEAHLNSLFSDIVRTRTGDASLVESGAKGGLVFFDHPSSFTTNDPAFFVDLYRKYPHFIGLEAFNGGEQLLNGIPYWDLVLDELMPDRPVWGLGNDDMHVAEQAGFNWNVFVLPELTEAEVRKAMESGHFYIGSGAAGPDVPVIRSITVNTNAGTITIQADNARTVSTVSPGKKRMPPLPGPLASL